jgi:hypothetical protein
MRARSLRRAERDRDGHNAAVEVLFHGSGIGAHALCRPGFGATGRTSP